MRLIIFAASYLFGLSNSLSITKGAPSQAVFALSIARDFAADEIYRGKLPSNGTSLMRKRTISNGITNKLLLYTTTALVGQPPQSISFLIDTGSGQLSIVDGKSDFCKTHPSGTQECKEFGAFDCDLSNTFKPIDNNFFDTIFVDNHHLSGIRATETMNFNGLTLENYVFDFALTTDSGHNTLGIGYARKQDNRLYPTFPERLVGMGRIKLNAYSVWLNSLEATSGLILYGGIDTAKIDGKLQTLPVYGLTKVIGDTTSVRELTVRLNDATFGEFHCPTLRVLLDTGSTHSYLPPSFVLPIVKALNAVEDPENAGLRFVDCGLRNYKTPIVFTFGIGSELVTIQVPMASMVYDDAKDGTLEKDGVRLCRFGLEAMGSDEDIGTLGDTFLRSAYTVYDLTNHQISLAQASYSEASSVMEIPKEGVSAMGLT